MEVALHASFVGDDRSEIVRVLTHVSPAASVGSLLARVPPFLAARMRTWNAALDGKGAFESFRISRSPHPLHQLNAAVIFCDLESASEEVGGESLFFLLPLIACVLASS
jgi:hypothetical protein